MTSVGVGYSRYYWVNPGRVYTILPDQLIIDIQGRINQIYNGIQSKEQTQNGDLFELSSELVRLENSALLIDKRRSRGACEWFITLFVHFVVKYPSISKLTAMTEVAKEFADGLALQEVLLQIAYDQGDDEELLDSLNIDLVFKRQIDRVNFADEMLKLSDGIYLISTDRSEGLERSFVIICFNGSYSLFLPGFGLVSTPSSVPADKEGEMAQFLTCCQKNLAIIGIDQLFQKSVGTSPSRQMITMSKCHYLQSS
jgi:hypothetical protein